MSEIVLTIAAHPDDEILGCGGTMARHTREGDSVYILILAEGVTSRDTLRDTESRSEELAELRKTAIRAGSIVGATAVFFGGFPDNRMDSLELLDVVKVVEEMIAGLRPTVLYTHHHGDLNIDHRITHQAVLTAARPLPGSSVKRIYSFEVPSATGWSAPVAANAYLPQCYVDISGEAHSGKNYLDLKMEALNVYAEEMREFPHARSVKALHDLALWRGSQVGLLAAEAFELYRSIDR